MPCTPSARRLPDDAKYSNYCGVQRHIFELARGLFPALDRKLLEMELVDSLRAPRKAFATIEGAGHFAVFTKQDAFLNELRARVLPLIR